jgi:hypothetical protein
MKDFTDWQVALQKTLAGRIWWANYRYDLEHGNLDHNTDVEFRSAVEAFLTFLNGERIHPIDVIKRVVDQQPGRFDLKGRRKPLTHESYCRVVTATDFGFHNVRWRSRGTPLDDRTGDRVWELLNTKITPAHYKGSMKTNREFFWCSHTQGVRMTASNAPSGGEATAVRNALGLDQINQGQRLLRIEIPDHTLVGKSTRAPTTLDAGMNTVFTPCNDADGLGWTMNLLSLRRSLREIVIEEMAFGKFFTVNRVGTVTDAVPDLDLEMVERQAIGR